MPNCNPINTYRPGWLHGILTILLLTAPAAAAGTLSQIGHDRWVTAAYIYDGDTFRTSDGEKIRLLGINTPESARNTEPGEPLAAKAKAKLKQLIAGQQLRLKFDRDKKDQYGRLLAQVFLRDGQWVNRLLVEAGLAHVYTFAPNFKWGEALLIAERKARQQQLGIWRQSHFRVLKAEQADRSQIGRFRLVEGRIDEVDGKGWSFRMDKLNISIPHKYRNWFGSTPDIQTGQRWLVRGKIRISSTGKLYLALHSPLDMEKMD